MKQYFDHYHIAESLEPRHALYGGRTNAAKLYHCCQGDEQIRYVDFTSLYPHVNRSKTVPTGHPEIITENFDEDISNYFGLIKCTVLPPRGLFHPVLPHHGENKLMFALCKTCADTGNQTPCTHSDAERAIQGTWCSVESPGKRLSHSSNARSVAFFQKVRYTVQGIYRHLREN